MAGGRFLVDPVDHGPDTRGSVTARHRQGQQAAGGLTLSTRRQSRNGEPVSAIHSRKDSHRARLAAWIVSSVSTEAPQVTPPLTANRYRRSRCSRVRWLCGTVADHDCAALSRRQACLPRSRVDGPLERRIRSPQDRPELPREPRLAQHRREKPPS